MSQEELVDALIQSLTMLTDHLIRENRLLESRDVAALAPLAAEKTRLTDTYLKAMAVIRRNPAIVSQAPETTKARLKRAGEAFNAAFEEHRRRVTVLKSVSEGLIKAVSSRVDEKNRVSSLYGEKALPKQAAPGTPTSIAFDRRI